MANSERDPYKLGVNAKEYNYIMQGIACSNG